MTQHRSASLSAHGAAFLFGLTGIFGALIQADSIVITCGRAGFAVAALALFAALNKLPMRLQLAQAGFLLMTGLLLAAHWVSFFIAVKVGGVALATLGFASFPAFIALIDVLVFGERIGTPERILLSLITLGLILVTPSFDFADQATSGLLWGIGSGLSFALIVIANRRGARGLDPLQVALWQNVVVAALLLPFAIAKPPALHPSDWIYLALLGVLCTALAQYLFVRSLQGLSARSAGMIIALEPVYAIACAWWLFAQQPSLRMLAGAALIICAIIWSARSAPGPAKAPAF
ncbi:MAG: DMT family transporter [Pseudomonadota bacterium]